MKTKEELNALKDEVEALNKKLAELSEDELSQVVGGDVTSANIVGYMGSVRPNSIESNGEINGGIIYNR